LANKCETDGTSGLRVDRPLLLYWGLSAGIALEQAGFSLNGFYVVSLVKAKPNIVSESLLHYSAC